MRYLGLLAVLALVLTPRVLAQDPFQGVPVEPRPSEYLHWDAKAAAGFKAELEERLRAGRPPEGQTPRLEGAQEFRVAKGDILHVPARVWHQVRVEPGQSITHALINVME